MDAAKNINVSDYIVPIRYKEMLIGTGIIHKSLLITAAHVVDELRIDKREFNFIYHNDTYILKWDRELFYEYDNIKHNYYRDLAIFKTDILIEGLSFESEIFYNDTVASLYGYYEDENKNNVVNISSGRIRMKPVLEKNIPINKNTFLLMDVHKTVECNSGCPLFNSNKNALGILSAGNQDYHYARFVSSSHILEVLYSESRCKNALLEFMNARK